MNIEKFRLWYWVCRRNETYRPFIPIPESYSHQELRFFRQVGGSLHLYVEEIDSEKISPVEHRLVFIKRYFPEEQKLKYEILNNSNVLI